MITKSAYILSLILNSNLFFYKWMFIDNSEKKVYLKKSLQCLLLEMFLENLSNTLPYRRKLPGKTVTDSLC